MDTKYAVQATDGTDMIDEDMVEVRPEKVNVSCLDENVCLLSCRKYCTNEAWMAIQSVVAVLRDNPVWYCGRCTKPINDDSESSIICDSCLTWYHFQCANISTNPKRKIWFCRDCYADCRTDEFED